MTKNAQDKITDINSRKNKARKTIEQIANDELLEYLRKSKDEPDALSSGDMKKIISGEEPPDDED